MKRIINFAVAKFIKQDFKKSNKKCSNERW
nr:MAG TPA: hypothetical protein [Caudoviricetes sp.]